MSHKNTVATASLASSVQGLGCRLRRKNKEGRKGPERWEMLAEMASTMMLKRRGRAPRWMVKIW